MARGSVFKRNGTYGFRVDLGPDPATGDRRQASTQGFRTKRAAEAALDEATTAVRGGVAVSKSSTDLGDFLDEWLEGERGRLKETTWASYEVAVARVKSRMGKTKLQAISPADLERLYKGLAESGGRGGRPLSAKSVRNTHVVVRKALSDAERLGVLPRNPASVARAPVPERKEQRTWSSDDLRDFLESLADDRNLPLYVLLATTGMRRGEAMGLRWCDLDLDGATLWIVQTLTTVNYEPVFSTPKTKRSRRLVYLDAETVRFLREHRRRQRSERIAAGPAWDVTLDLVFCDELGGVLHPDHITREFTTRSKQANVPVIRLHDLRHTYATLALKAGVHPKIVSERLGHATVGVTLDLYSHVTPGLGREAADAVAASIFG